MEYKCWRGNDEKADNPLTQRPTRSINCTGMLVLEQGRRRGTQPPHTTAYPVYLLYWSTSILEREQRKAHNPLTPRPTRSINYTGVQVLEREW